MPQKTPEQWLEIQSDYESGEFTQKALAAKWDVSQASITTHRNKKGWINPRTGEPHTPSVKEKRETQVVPEGEISAQMNKEQVDAALDDIKAGIEGVVDDELERTQRELEEVKAELAALKPKIVERAVDFDSAAGMLAKDMRDRVQMELNTINDERAKRNLPYYTIEDKDAAQPGWSQEIRERIIQDTVDDLTKWASNDGPSLHKVDMLRPDGVTIEQIPIGPNMDNGTRPERLRARGWKDVANQSCPRWNCHQVPPKGNPYGKFHSAIHEALFNWQYPTPDQGVTTTAVFNAD